MRKRRVSFLAILLVATFFLIGLYYYNASRNLRFEVVGVGLRDLGLTGATLEISVEVSNPSWIPVYLTSTSFDIFVNGQFVGNGGTEAVTIGGSSSKVITATVTFKYADIAPTMISVIKKGGTATIMIAGVAHLFIFNIPFTNTTTIKISKGY